MMNPSRAVQRQRLRGHRLPSPLRWLPLQAPQQHSLCAHQAAQRLLVLRPLRARPVRTCSMCGLGWSPRLVQWVMEMQPARCWTHSQAQQLRLLCQDCRARRSSSAIRLRCHFLGWAVVCQPCRGWAQRLARLAVSGEHCGMCMCMYMYVHTWLPACCHTQTTRAGMLLPQRLSVFCPIRNLACSNGTCAFP